jgi:hypothetical protein
MGEMPEGPIRLGIMRRRSNSVTVQQMMLLLTADALLTHKILYIFCRMLVSHKALLAKYSELNI